MTMYVQMENPNVDGILSFGKFKTQTWTTKDIQAKHQ